MLKENISIPERLFLLKLIHGDFDIIAWYLHEELTDKDKLRDILEKLNTTADKLNLPVVFMPACPFYLFSFGMKNGLYHSNCLNIAVKNETILIELTNINGQIKIRECQTPDFTVVANTIYEGTQFTVMNYHGYLILILQELYPQECSAIINKIKPYRTLKLVEVIEHLIKTELLKNE